MFNSRLDRLQVPGESAEAGGAGGLEMVSVEIFIRALRIQRRAPLCCLLV